MRRLIYIVAIELYGKPPATCVVDGELLTPADTQMSVLGSDTDYVGVCLGELFDYLPRAVCGVVVDDDNIVLEVGNLAQCRTYGIGDSILAVADWDYNRRFYSEIASVDIDLLWSSRKQPPDTLQMSRASPLHIELIEIGRASCRERV